MNELLQKHGCSNVFNIPEGLRELMSDITREVLREQPPKIFDFIANYLSVLLITREHGIMAVKILDDLCDCRPSVSEHLMSLGFERQQAAAIAEVIKEEIEKDEPTTEEGQEKVNELQILKRILTRHTLDEETTAKVSQVARNAYRDYWYRKQLLQQSLKESPDQPWEIAAQHTLDIYKKTKPSFDELTRATQLIQAAYRGYYVRRNMLRHLKPKPKPGPKVELPGPPVDVASSREIDLGRVINIKVKEDNTGVMFDMKSNVKLGLGYDPQNTLTHVEDERFLASKSQTGPREGVLSDRRASRPSMAGRSDISGSMVRSRMMSEASPDARAVASRTTSMVSQGQLQSSFPDGQSARAIASRTTSMVSQGQLQSSFPDGQSARAIASRTTSMVSQGQLQSSYPDGQSARAIASRTTSMVSQGHLQSSYPEGQSQLLKFAEAPPEVIVTEKVEEIVEEEAQVTHELDVPKIQSEVHFEKEELQEVIADETPAEAPAEADVAPEVPEELVDDRTEGDGVSGADSSMATTAPVTDDATDIEEVGDLNTTGEEEGE